MLRWIILAVLPLFALSERMQMKVVEAPTNLGHQQPFQPVAPQILRPRVPPSNFSGPPHLSYLKGRCYEKLVGDYRYELCPFDNVTQHEVALRWNSYSGVIGVWRDWVIKNNTFSAMNMPDGDSCGGAFRSVKVFLACDVSGTVLANVTEPSMCNYEITLVTPLVCHPDAMLVFPTLPENLRDEWDTLESLLTYAELTEIGYARRLRELFIKAGYVVEKETVLREQRRIEQRRKTDLGQFDSLTECQVEYRKLKRKLEAYEMFQGNRTINEDPVL